MASAQRLIIGAKMTTTGVLFRKAEMPAMVGSMRSCTCRMEAPLPGSRRPSRRSSRPERLTPSLTRKSRATVIMPLLENPSSISSGLSMPAHRKATAPESRMRPGRMRSRMRATMTKARTMRTKMAGRDMVAGR